MNTSIWTRMMITALAVCTVAALAAPTSGQTLRRDGSKAVPFVADVSKETGPVSSGIALRRDGSKAVPVVADLEPQTPAAPAADGFDWRDAAIGAGLGAAAVVLGGAGASAVRGRRGGLPTSRPTSRAASS
jgi:hypothetical protein